VALDDQERRGRIDHGREDATYGSLKGNAETGVKENDA
jgi:hypothetical protein